MQKTPFKPKVKIIDYSVQLGEATIPLQIAKKAPIVKSLPHKTIKGTSPTKKTVKKVKEKTVTQLKKILWELCKNITRALYVRPDGYWDCFTCGKIITEPAKAHTAHFIPSASCGAFLRYDLRNLRVCCYFCNINCGGAGALYYKNLVLEKGQDYVDQIFKDKNVSIKADVHWYKKMVALYSI